MEKDRTRFLWIEKSESGERLRSLKLRGHMMLVRRCDNTSDGFLIGEVPQGKEVPREADAIIAHHNNRTDSMWHEVLAAGSLCDDEIVPGAKVILPLQATKEGTVFRGVFNREYDAIVDECEAIAVVPPS